MSRWKPCKRRRFIRRLRSLGFNGPCSGTRLQFLVYGQHRLVLVAAGGIPLALFRGSTLRLDLCLVTFGAGLGMALESGST